jgi:hypothetical protein
MKAPKTSKKPKIEIWSREKTLSQLYKGLDQLGWTLEQFEEMDHSERTKTLLGLHVENMLALLEWGARGDETNSRIDRNNRRDDLRCSYCPPNKDENRKTHKRHGVKKPRSKKPEAQMSMDEMPCGCLGHLDNDELCRYPQVAYYRDRYLMLMESASKLAEDRMFQIMDLEKRIRELEEERLKAQLFDQDVRLGQLRDEEERAEKAEAVLRLIDTRHNTCVVCRWNMHSNGGHAPDCGLGKVVGRR